MAYETMKTKDLKMELFRRIEDIDSWANEVNIKKAKDDITDELDKGDKFDKQLDEKINKCIKKYRIFKTIAIISFVLSVVSFLFTFILDLRIEFSIAFSFLTMLFASLTKCDVDLRNEHQERAEILFWYYSLMQEASIKQLYKKAYDNLYTKIIERDETENAKLKEQLTKAKAKKIIKDLLSELDDLSELSDLGYNSKLEAKAKQFLKDNQNDSE